MKVAVPSRLIEQLFVLGLLVFLVSSCATDTQPTNSFAKPSSKVAATTSSRWVKVRSNPPTWYPQGVDANTPTNHWNGDWVYTQDGVDTRFFIPRRGLSPERRNALLKEATAARDENNIAIRDRADDRERTSAAINEAMKDAPITIIKVPMWILAIMGSGL